MFLSWDEGALVNFQPAFPMACIGGRTGTCCISGRKLSYIGGHLLAALRKSKEKKMILINVLLQKAILEVQKHPPFSKMS